MPRPRLLISVRSAGEAGIALAAGVDLIDVKEPQRGALGMADGNTIGEILELLADRVPTSVALGELTEGGQLPRLKRTPTYAKFGLAGTRGLADWQAALGRAIALLPQGVQPVAVAYGDWQAAGAPRPSEVLEAATTLGCRGLLIDTFDKRAGSLLVHMDVAELCGFVHCAKQAGLLTVVAGGLRATDLAELGAIGPDYFGFRGAACGGERTGQLDRNRVELLRERLRGEQDEFAGPRARSSQHVHG